MANVVILVVAGIAMIVVAVMLWRDDERWH